MGVVLGPVFEEHCHSILVIDVDPEVGVSIGQGYHLQAIVDQYEPTITAL